MDPITTPEVLSHGGLASPYSRAFVVATGVGVLAYGMGFPRQSFTEDGEMKPFALLNPGPHGRTGIDLSGSTRPGGVRGSGREGKTKNKKQRGPGLGMPKDLVQEGCNGRNGRNGPQTRKHDGGRGHPDLRWNSTTQSTQGFDGRRGHP